MSSSRFIKLDLKFHQGLRIAHLDFYDTSISLTVESAPRLGSDHIDGYVYYAHIKRDPTENWASNIPPERGGMPGEQRARTSRLWEGCRDYTYNHVRDPENNRPPLSDLISQLQERRFIAEAELLREVYRVE